MKGFIVTLALALVLGGCAKAPPELSPAGNAAFQAAKVVRTLDIVRDVATDAHAQVPPLISTDNTRRIVTWHSAALRTIGAAPGGWKPTVLAGLDQLEKVVPPAEWVHVEVYVRLLRTIIAEVQQ